MSASLQNAVVHKWLISPPPADVAAAIVRLSRTDDACHIAIMPDVHLARDVCVGIALATRRLIYPQAVGGDIGCGMLALAFDAGRDLLADERHAGRLLGALPRAVPAIRHAHRAGYRLPQELEAMPLGNAKLQAIRQRDGVVQFATLGRGNHFLEFQADEDDRLWLLIHSGSRAMGQAIREAHLANATRSCVGLYYLDSHDPRGQAYLNDMEFARAYARQSRRAMANATAALVNDLFGVKSIPESTFDCDHNHVRRETHGGEERWVHRKGASSAAPGEAGIIPGSMGTQTYHVTGRGCPEALCSSSHGAGRAMSREQARRALRPRDLARQLKDVWFDHRLTDALRDEAPSAYKDVRAVMRAQRELTRITRRLRPVLCYKSG
ncbi:MAG TPA: RtcB family protein [Tepidisphaeraceae bacterium]|nr:RtcB family protein [Tepidisphaeraceae bacterium]